MRFPKPHFSSLITPALVLLGALAAGLPKPANATGIPTVDVAAVMQMQQQFQQLLKQYQTMRQQYETMRRQYEAVTGSYGRGRVGLQEAARATAAIPGTWQDVVEMQKQGVFGQAQQRYEKALKTVPQELLRDPSGQGAKTYKISSDAVSSGMAGGEVLYGEVQDHLRTLMALAQMVDQTTNVKDATDLQARIAAENGLVQTAMAKLNALNLNVQSSMLNQQNQAQAVSQARYPRKEPALLPGN